MDEADERALLESYQISFISHTAASRRRMAEIARRMRLEVAEHSYPIPAAVGREAAQHVIASLGEVLEHGDAAVSVMVKSQLGVNRTVLTSTFIDDERSGPTLLLRAATLEGKLSWHVSSKVMRRACRALETAAHG